MATSTTNLGLTKPSVNDAADIGVLNSNFDKIDAKIPAAGAAPSGYGLGTIAKEITDANTATASGWYSIGAITPSSAHVPFQYVLLEVKAHSNRFIVQHLYRWMTDSPSMRRVYSDGWGEWEWVNPPMQLGVEYRTTERWNGKPVYAYAIDCGKYPATAGGTGVAHGRTVKNIVQVGGEIYYGDKNNAAHLVAPYITANAGLYVSANANEFILYTARDGFDQYGAHAWMKYTKE